MVYTCSELIKKLGSFSKIRSSLDKGRIFKISHGLYTDDRFYMEKYTNLFSIYPNAIMTLQSAFAYYDLTDYIPIKDVIVTPLNAHKINEDRVKQMYMSKNIINIGKVTIKNNGETINIYDLERMLIELFRLKSKIGYDIYKEVVNNYRQLVKEDKIDFGKLSEYCQHFKNGANITKKIQEIVM